MCKGKCNCGGGNITESQTVQFGGLLNDVFGGRIQSGGGGESNKGAYVSIAEAGDLIKELLEDEKEA